MIIRGLVVRVRGKRAVIRYKHQELLVTFKCTTTLRAGDYIRASGTLYNQRYLTENLTVKTIKAFSAESVTVS